MKKTFLTLFTAILFCLFTTACAASPANDSSAETVQLTQAQETSISEDIEDLIRRFQFDQIYDTYEITDFTVDFAPCTYEGFSNAVLATVSMDYTSSSDPEQRPAIRAMRYVRDSLTDPEQIKRVQTALDGLLAEYEGYETDYGSHTDETCEFVVNILSDNEDDFLYSLYYLYTSSNDCVTPVPAAPYFEHLQVEDEEETAYGIQLALEALYQTETD